MPSRKKLGDVKLRPLKQQLKNQCKTGDKVRYIYRPGERISGTIQRLFGSCTLEVVQLELEFISKYRKDVTKLSPVKLAQHICERDLTQTDFSIIVPLHSYHGKFLPSSLESLNTKIRYFVRGYVRDIDSGAVELADEVLIDMLNDSYSSMYNTPVFYKRKVSTDLLDVNFLSASSDITIVLDREAFYPGESFNMHISLENCSHKADVSVGVIQCMKHRNLTSSGYLIPTVTETNHIMTIKSSRSKMTQYKNLIGYPDVEEHTRASSSMTLSKHPKQGQAQTWICSGLIPALPPTSPRQPVFGPTPEVNYIFQIAFIVDTWPIKLTRRFNLPFLVGNFPGCIQSELKSVIFPKQDFSDPISLPTKTTFSS